MSDNTPPSPLVWAVAQQPQPGQDVSGDGYVAELLPNGMLACVIDGLGHGQKAHEAAVKAVKVIGELLDQPMESIFKRAHSALIGTRGAVISVALLDIPGKRMHWAGVGNVAAVLIPAKGDAKQTRRHLMLRGGIVGYRMPPIKTFTETLNPGDTLIFATDGIRSGFLDDIPHTKAPQEIADHLLAKHLRGTDDALALVIRYPAVQMTL